MSEIVGHVWEPMREYDSCVCAKCGQVATMTEVGSEVFPVCKKQNLDEEFQKLLEGEIPPAEEEL